MCGRITQLFDWAELHRLYSLQDLPLSGILNPFLSYNVCPSTNIYVVNNRGVGDTPFLCHMKWGFKPAWATDGKPPPINAKSETAATSPMFRSAMKSRRCLIPASGFYEWQPVPGVTTKQPWYIYPKSAPLFSLAGIWEEGGEDAKENPPTVAILTTEPNSLVAPVHNRMPVIVPPERYSDWLYAKGDTDSFFEPFPAEQMDKHKVSTAVNKPGGNHPSFIERQLNSA